MFTTLPVFPWGAMLASTSSACTSSIVAAAAFCAGTFAAFFHGVGSREMLTSLISLAGLAIIADGASLSLRERLRRAEELYRVLIETTTDGVWMVDREHRTTFFNRRIPEMLGCAAGELQGHLLFDFMFPEDVSGNPPDFLRPRHSKEVVRHRFRRKDGSELWARVAASPLFPDRGEFAGLMLIVSDVTLLCSMEEGLRRNEKLITAGRLAATISHEINGPLETVASNLCVLRAEGTTEQGQQYLTLAQKEIQRVASITKRTLMFFRDSASWEELSLLDLLDDTISLCRNKLLVHSIRVITDYRVSGMVRGSRGGIQQVFANLISNAVDAMNSGGTLTIRVTDGTSTNAPAIRVEVEDTGKGVSTVELNRIFEPFFTTKQNEGTGLGLWLTKEIVEKHGGSVAVTSPTLLHEKCGTRFSVLLPGLTVHTATVAATA